MLTWIDCLGLCDLTEAEIEAVAEHEHLPEIVALELGNYLVHSTGGVPMIKHIIRDDIAAAQARGDHRHAATLKLVLRHFIDTHPERAKAVSVA